MSDLDGSRTPLIPQLERFRRRLILVALVRLLPVAAAIAVGAAVVLAQVARWGANGALMAAALSTGVASVVAAVIAYRRTGGLVQVAATLDRRFELANRLATAMAFAGDDDGMATLIAADAQVTLGRRRPQDVAFESPRHLTWIVVGTAAVVVASVFASQPSSDSDASVASQGVLGDTAPAAAASGRALASPPQTSSASEAARVQPADANAGRAAAASSAARKPGSLDEPASQSTSREAADRPAERDAESRRTPSIDPARTPAGANGASAGQRANDARSANANSASPNQAQQARGNLGGGAGANAVRSTTARAGGVRGDANLSATSPQERVALTPRAATTPSAAWDRAESAIEREHLPLDLRTYVRDYLVAIRSGGLP